MYKRILVAIDASSNSQQALKEAISLTKLYQGTLEIVHVVDANQVQSITTHGTALSNVDPFQETPLQQGERILAQAMSMANSAGITHAARLLNTQSLQVDEQVAEAIEQGKIDLLVVGSHGRRGLRRLLFGSVAERLMRKLSVSILIVRTPEDVAPAEPSDPD